MLNVNLKEFRTKHKLSQISMAAKLGISLFTYVTWEKGVGNPNEDNQVKLDRLVAEMKDRE